MGISTFYLNTLIFLGLVGLSLFISLLVTGYLCNPSSLRMMDTPNDRSLHSRPIPRGGGLGIMAGISVAGGGAIWCNFLPEWTIWLYAATLLIAVISLLDDFSHVPAGYRLVTHFFAASILLPNGFKMGEMVFPWLSLLLPVWVEIVFSLLFMVWMTNLYNFMDGMDGLAGGMAVIGFGGMAALGYLSGHGDFAAVNIIIAAAVAGFLVYNFSPARIFMGDVGSASLGFLAGGMSLWGVQTGVFKLWAPVLIFSPFIVDATVTLFLRIWRGEKFWQAHRSHYYQRLVLAGWSHRKAAIAEYVVMAASGTSAILLSRWDGDAAATVGMLVWVLIYLGLMIGVKRVEARMVVTAQDACIL